MVASHRLGLSRPLRLLAAAPALALLTYVSSPARADETLSRFDAPALLPFVNSLCEPCTESDDPYVVQRGPLPGEKWIELRIPVTHWLRDGSAATVAEIEYSIVETTGRARVVDFSPQAQMASDLAGNISVERKDDSTRSTNVDLAGAAYGPVNVGGHANSNQSHSEVERFERLAPTRQVVASGTTQQGRGVSLRVRSATGLPLEGAMEVSLTLAVPESCDALLLRVVGQASGRVRRSFPATDYEGVLGREQLWIAAFAANSTPARQRAEQFASAMHDLRRSAVTHPVRNGSSTPLAQVRRLFREEAPKVPTQWLEQLLVPGSDVHYRGFADGLAAPVREQAETYLARRDEFLNPRIGSAPSLATSNLDRQRGSRE